MKFDLKLSIGAAIVFGTLLGCHERSVNKRIERDIEKAKIEADAKIKVAEMENKKKRTTNNKDNHE